jgi:hypothetical protein
VSGLSSCMTRAGRTLSAHPSCESILLFSQLLPVSEKLLTYSFFPLLSQICSA